MSSRKSLLIGAGLLLMLIGASVFSQQARADEVLVAAPSAGLNYYGMYCVSCIGAQFTLTGSYDVSTIDIVLRTPDTTSFTTLDFSLLSSVAPSVISSASAALTVSLGTVSTEVMNVNQILPAGTYYLVGNVPGYLGTPVTAGDVDGWMLSTGVYNDAHGIVFNGLGGFNGPACPVCPGGHAWSTYTAPGYYAPAFTVNGAPVARTVPEPSVISLLLGGLAVVIFVTRRKIYDPR